MGAKGEPTKARRLGHEVRSSSVISADNLALLLPCLRSVFENTYRVHLEVYLVDNASTDGTAAAIEAKFPQVKVLRNEDRLGFSTNNNMVLRRGQGRYLMLLNDDTLVLDGALDRMVEFMDAHPQVGAVGSHLENADGSLQLALPVSRILFSTLFGRPSGQVGQSKTWISRLLWTAYPVPPLWCAPRSYRWGGGARHEF